MPRKKKESVGAARGSGPQLGEPDRHFRYNRAGYDDDDDDNGDDDDNNDDDNNPPAGHCCPA